MKKIQQKFKYKLLLSFLLISYAVSAQEPYLVKDINQFLNTNPVTNITNAGGITYFIAKGVGSGLELWKSDGMGSGTVIVKDINPGSGDSNPQNLTNVNGILFFIADDGINGRALWKSDGTDAGTVMIININSGKSNPSLLKNVNGTLFFLADDGINGRELWKSDGTAAGTFMLKDIYSGLASPNINAITNLNGILYFTANDGINGTELWKSDGTVAGTVMVKDINSGSLSSNVSSSLTNLNGIIYFSANDGINGTELWKTDGTDIGTVMVKDINPNGTNSSFPNSLFNCNGILYFTANNGIKGTELWKTDGTDIGTVMVKDINPNGTNGINSSSTGSLFNYNGILYFTAIDGLNGQELWKSDGTAEGTIMVKDISPGVNKSSSPQRFTIVNGELYFVANNGLSGGELWKSDGTANGTMLVKDIYPGIVGTVYNSSNPNVLIDVNGTLYFVANDGVRGMELWKSDGTEAGTIIVKDINAGIPTSNPYYLTNVNGMLYFSANNGANGSDLWKSDGTEEGTVMVKDIYTGTQSSSPNNLANVDEKLFFTADNGINGYELWKSDGTAAGTNMIKEIILGRNGSYPGNFVYLNGVTYFAASDSLTGMELWKSDGTEDGTALVKDIYPGMYDMFGTNEMNSSGPDKLTVFNGVLYFTAENAVYGRELWKSDGTAEGTVMVKDIYPGSNPGLPMSGMTNPMTVVNGVLYFSANDGVNGYELWKSDGTAEGTVMVVDIYEGPQSSNPQNLTNVNGTIFFTANDSVNGTELWKCYGNSLVTVMVKDIFQGSNSSFSNYLTNVNGVLYFAANDGVNGTEVWKSDGTTDGTVMVKDIYPGVNMGSSPANLININGILYFVATNPNMANRRELWQTDGTESSTSTLRDITHGSFPLYPQYLTYVNGLLYFAAQGDFGVELYAFKPLLSTPLPKADSQKLPVGSTVANLTAEGSNLKWYATATGDASLSSTTVLKTAKYYVTQTINGIESKRLAVQVTLVPHPIAGVISKMSDKFCIGSRQPLWLKVYNGDIQWQQSYDDVEYTDIDGATYANYVTEPLYEVVTYYRVKVSIGEETVYSPTVVLSPSDTYQNEIYIAANDDYESQTVCASSNSTNLSLINYEEGSITWYKSTNINTGIGWSAITGATTEAYTATNLKMTTWYMAKVNNGTCTTFSNRFAVYVDKAPVAGTIKATAEDFYGNEVLTNSVGIGFDITFKTSGYIASDFQWQVSTDNKFSWEDVGENSSVFTMTNVVGAANSIFYVRVKVTNGICDGIVTSAVKAIKIIAPVSVTSISGGNTVCFGGGGKLILATGYYGMIQWQYSIDGENFINVGKGSTTTLFNSGSFKSLSSGTAATYLVSNVTITTYFRAHLSSGAYTTTDSNVDSFIVGTSPVAGIISGQDRVCYGKGTTLTLAGSEGSIQWEASTNNGTYWYQLYGKTGKTLITNNLYYSTMFRAKVSVCSSDYAYFSVTVDGAIARNITSPTTGGSTSTTPLCTSFSTVKVLNVGQGYLGTVSWEYSPTATVGSWTSIETASGPSYTINYALPGLNYYRAKFSGGSCSPVVVYSNILKVYYQSCSSKFGASNDIVESKSLNVNAYPNPFNDSFRLKVTSMSEENIGLSVYDITGRLLEQRKLKFNEFENIEIGDWYPSGVYIGIFVQGTEQKTLRIMKN